MLGRGADSMAADIRPALDISILEGRVSSLKLSHVKCVGCFLRSSSEMQSGVPALCSCAASDSRPKESPT